MGAWTHAICEPCWQELEPLRVPVRLKGAPPQRCCYCGAFTAGGIYVRASPETTPCRGRHDRQHDDEP